MTLSLTFSIGPLKVKGIVKHLVPWQRKERKTALAMGLEIVMTESLETLRMVRLRSGGPGLI